MKKHFWWITCALLTFSVTIISWRAENITESNKIVVVNKPVKSSAKELFTQYLDQIYNTAQLSEAGLDLAVFQRAAIGYFNLKASNKVSQYSSIITIVDLAKSSCAKRMWVIDVISKELILNTWVAHGNGSGNDMADHFSNENDSHASSLGFYITDDIYNGKHGRSLRLDGLDSGFNDNARARSIVVHAAQYVSKAAINEKGRLGRSEGCPALSPKVAGKVINIIKGKTVLFINGNDSNYTSRYLDEETAANYVYPDGDVNVNASL
jgi:L,D-transpeptidase catalytic domain